MHLHVVRFVGILLACGLAFAGCRSGPAASAGTDRKERVLVTGSLIPVPAEDANGTLPSTAQTVRRIPAAEIESKGRGSLVDALRLVPQIR
jgi:hypothetical protein